MDKLIRPSTYLDPKNWAKSFIKFVEMIGKADDQQGRYVRITFAESDKIEFIWSRESMIQLFTLMNIIDDVSYRNAVCLRRSHLSQEVFQRSNETILKLRDKLKLIKSDDYFPSGWEELEDIKYKGWTTYSVETFDDNRLIYVPKIEVKKVYIVSIYGHYKDKPKRSSDKLVSNMIANEEDRNYSELEENSELFKRRYLK